MMDSLNVQHYREELEAVLKSPVLRVFFWRLIVEDCRVFQSDFSLNASAYALLAKQEIGKRLLEDAKRINPEAVFLAETEYNDLQSRSLNFIRNQNEEGENYGG